MRHRRKGRKLGRNPNHQRAMLRNLASALILTERDPDDLRFIELESAPNVKGRIVTTVAKAKEVRPLVEKCVTIAKRSMPAQQAAQEYAPSAERGTDAWKSWRQSDRWGEWNQAIAPVVAARRRCLQLLGDKMAVSVLFEEIAPRFADRPGGYTRVLKLANPRLGDAGSQAILEFVGVRDRVKQTSERPAFDAPEDEAPASAPASETTDQEQDEQPAEEQAAAGESASEGDAEEKKD